MKTTIKINLLIAFISSAIILINCGDDEEQKCTFESDPICYCTDNPGDTQCDEICTPSKTFAEDPDCFCDNNPDDSQCEQLKFEKDPVNYSIDNPDSPLATDLLEIGTFESDTTGVVKGADATDGGMANEGWYFAAGSSPDWRAKYSIVESEGVDNSKALKVELLTEQTSSWQQQITFTKNDVTVNRRFVMLVDIKPDKAGRTVKVHVGIDGSREEYSYWDFIGSFGSNDNIAEEYVLESGWQTIGIICQPPSDPDPDNYPGYDPKAVDHVRPQLSFAYAANYAGGMATFLIDNIRVIDAGAYLDHTKEEDQALYCLYYKDPDVCGD
jgi:hypothetical protein